MLCHRESVLKAEQEVLREMRFHFFIFLFLFVTKSTCCGSWALRKSVWTYSPNFVGEMIQPSGKTLLPQVAHYPCHCVWSIPAHSAETRKNSRSSLGHLCWFFLLLLFFSSSSLCLSCSWPCSLHRAPPAVSTLLCLPAWPAYPSMLFVCVKFWITN